MAKRQTSSDDWIAGLKPGKKGGQPVRKRHPVPDCRGLYVAVTPKKTRSFYVVTRGPDGRQVGVTLGEWDRKDFPIDRAREEAAKAWKRIRAGEAQHKPAPAPAAAAKPASFRAIAERYLQREAARFLRVAEKKRILEKHAFPAFGDRPIVELRRSDIVAVLDTVHDPVTGKGSRMADKIADEIYGVLKWYGAALDEDYRLPARPQRRNLKGAKNENARPVRALKPAELKSLWAATDDGGVYSQIVRALLLTGQRLTKVSHMAWCDVDLEAGTWTVPRAPREKGVGGHLKLPQLAVDILKAQHAINSNGWVFPGRFSRAPFNGGSLIAKKALDLNASIAPWTLHCLRHTASTMMAEANVRPEIKEAVLGHDVPGIEGRYSHADLVDQKAAALETLARAVAAAINPGGGDNVVKLQMAAEG